MRVAAAGRGVCVASGGARNRKSPGGARKTSGVSESLLWEREGAEKVIGGTHGPCLAQTVSVRRGACVDFTMSPEKMLYAHEAVFIRPSTLSLDPSPTIRAPPDFHQLSKCLQAIKQPALPHRKTTLQQYLMPPQSSISPSQESV